MKRASKILGMVVLSVPFALMAQQTISFGPNKGQPVLTQNQIDESRQQQLVQKLTEIGAQIKASNEATNQLLAQLIQLQAESNKQMAAFSQVNNAPARAIPVTPAPAPTSTPITVSGEGGATPEMLSLQRTMISRLDEQTGLLKITNALLTKMAEEQKWSNALMQSFVEGKKR